jgi:hypothetical protein
MGKGSWFVLGLLLIGLLLAGCGGDADGGGAGVTPGETRTGADSQEELPATNDIATAVPAIPTTITPDGTPTTPLGEDDFLAIDEILGEIDNDVCQTAFETKLELEALIAEGVDVAELETAVEELIEQLENCQTPTPAP